MFRSNQDVNPRASKPGGLKRLTTPPKGLAIQIRSELQTRPSPAGDSVVVPVQYTEPPAPGILPSPLDLPDTAAPPEETIPPPVTRGAPPAGGGALPDPLQVEPELDRAPVVPTVPTIPGTLSPPTGLEPIPDSNLPPGRPARPAPQPGLPILPDTLRVTRIQPRNGGPEFNTKTLPNSDGYQTALIVGGVNIVTSSPKFGIIDISADNVIIWRKLTKDGQGPTKLEDGSDADDAREPLEFYLEGNVVVYQDQRKVAGPADQKTYRANQAYYEVSSERAVFLDAEVNVFAPGLVTPARVLTPRIDQYRPLEPDGNGNLVPGSARIRAGKSMTTGSRFPTPGYKITSRSTDAFQVPSTKKKRKQPANPNQLPLDDDPKTSNDTNDLTWKFDMRQNFFFMGPVPFFYWPKITATADDLQPPLRQVMFGTNNYFGEQLLTDWNGYRLLGIQKPLNIDLWNLDLDYLSRRTKNFPALGTEIGWSGRNLIEDFTDPYGEVKDSPPTLFHDYIGYFDIWGLKDSASDNLGSGPAVVTNNPKAGNIGIQRGADPSYTNYRGHENFRHMQRFLPDDEDHLYEDLRGQIEIGYATDRNFLEEYYKRLFDVGMDQETLGYLIRQKDNTAWTIWGEANLQSWYTDTQWLPKLDYYRLGDRLLGGAVTYFTHSGIDYANVHTANEVNNKSIFAFIPYDPISNTSGVWQSGRAYTTHEFDLPFALSDVARFVPYVQGQAVGWTNQINGQDLGRVWGAGGAKFEAMAWKLYPGAESEILNVHGINHKINFEADYRDSYSNVNLNKIGVQDDLDDNTYEYVRRYFALTNYAGGILPQQYDPRYLILRRTLSPITGTTDVQASMQTLHLGLHQRLQTKRGPEGKRRIIDYMTLDFDTTYFPQANRDNFGKSFGQNMYLWQWFIGDRTSIVSYGWFEFWTLGGTPIYNTNINRHNDPFGLNVVTSGINISRPPRGNIFIGYTVIDSGPINTSALNFTTSYWLSPKWYATFGTSYDFGNAILLGGNASVTRIGADYLTTVGITGDPQRESYMFAFSITPRVMPNMGTGSTGMTNFDPRYAPTQ